MSVEAFMWVIKLIKLYYFFVFHHDVFYFVDKYAIYLCTYILLQSPAEQNPVRKLSHKVTKSPVLDTLECRVSIVSLKLCIFSSKPSQYKNESWKTLNMNPNDQKEGKVFILICTYRTISLECTMHVFKEL